MRSLVLIAAILICSCTTTEYVSSPLPLPDTLGSHELPTEAELACVSDETYAKIVKMHKRILTLEEIIKSTH